MFEFHRKGASTYYRLKDKQLWMEPGADNSLQLVKVIVAQQQYSKYLWQVTMPNEVYKKSQWDYHRRNP